MNAFRFLTTLRNLGRVLNRRDPAGANGGDFEATPDKARVGKRLFYGMALGRVGAILLSRGDRLITWGVMPLWGGHAEGDAWRAAAASGAVASVPVEGKEPHWAGSFQAWFTNLEDRPLPALRPAARTLLLPWANKVCSTYDAVDRRSVQAVFREISVGGTESPEGGIALLTDLALEDARVLVEGGLGVEVTGLPGTLRLHIALSADLVDTLIAEEAHFQEGSGVYLTFLEQEKVKGWRAFQAFLASRACDEKPPERQSDPPEVEAKGRGASVKDFDRMAGLLRGALHTALMEAGEGGPLRSWEVLRKTIRDIFMASGVPKTFQDLAMELSREYGPFIWALARHLPEDRALLERFLERYAPRPWESFLAKEPRHSLDCYQALEGLSETRPSAFLVVAKAGILWAQEEGDPFAEGLLWSSLADLLLHNYGNNALAMAPHARSALERLMVCGTRATLVMAGRFDAFEGPMQEVRRLLGALPAPENQELQAFLSDLDLRYGAAFVERNGRRMRP